MTLRRWIPRLAALAALVLVALLLKATLFAPQPIPVRVAAVESGRVEETVTNSRAGTVKSRRRARLSPEIGGKVIALPFREGDEVRAGQVLLQLDSSLQRASLALAERDLGAAEAQRDQACLAADRAGRERGRTERLAGDGIVSADLLDRVASEAEAAEAACRAATAVTGRATAAVALARAQVEQTTLRAPFSGLLAELLIEVGEWTTPSPPALPVPAAIDLIDTSAIYVSAPMDEVDSARLRPGMSARVTVDSHPGRSFTARVARVAPFVLDQLEQNRTVEIEVELEDRGLAESLLPGTSADAEAILSVREGVLRIPTSALFEEGKVLLLDGEVLVERRIEVGLRNWDYTEVGSGLRPGERVVVALDRPEIKAGARVRADEPRDTP